MVKYPFSYQESNISYSVGNPMGAYSSWSSFALAHHFLIYYCCQINGIDWKSCQYCILGDDVLIRDDLVAKSYLEVIERIGLEYSPAKTHVSDHFFEIAKRLFYKNEEVSPFPISSIKESSKRFYLLAELIRQQMERGINFSSGIMGGCETFYGMVKGFPSRLKSKLSSQAHISDLMTKIIKDPGNAGIYLNEIFSCVNQRSLCPPFTNTEACALVSNIAVELFTDSNPANYSGRKPTVGLGNLAITLVTRLTEVDRIGSELAFDVIMCLPVLGGYSRIEETFIALSRKASNYSDWPMMLKTMSLPWDDAVFYTRSSELVVSSQSKILTHLKDRFTIFETYPQLRESSFFLVKPIFSIMARFLRSYLGPVIFFSFIKSLKILWSLPKIRLIFYLIIGIILSLTFSLGHILLGFIPLDIIETGCNIPEILGETSTPSFL
jgi:hypothetical protein